MKSEPAALLAAVSVALTATLAVLAFVFHIADDLRVLLDAALVAWIAVAGAWVRSRVTPVP